MEDLKPVMASELRRIQAEAWDSGYNSALQYVRDCLLKQYHWKNPYDVADSNASPEGGEGER